MHAHTSTHPHTHTYMSEEGGIAMAASSTHRDLHVTTNPSMVSAAAEWNLHS